MTLFQLIKEDFSVPKQKDPALHSKIELIFNYPGVWAVVNYRIANYAAKKGFKRTARIISGISQFFTNVDIHPCATIGRRIFIDHAFGVVIGETTIIHDDVLIYQGVTLGGVSLSNEKRHPTVESNVIIGSGAKVLGNITIGRDSKIGANSVVVRDVKPCSTAVGIPARIINKCEEESELAHNIIPDINKEMFQYLIKRVAILEHAIKEKDGIDVSAQDEELEKIYSDFINSIDN